MTQWHGMAPESNGYCWCGCGSRVSGYFVTGHDGDALHKVIQMVYGGSRDNTGTVRFLRAHGYGANGQNVQDAWQRFNA